MWCEVLSFRDKFQTSGILLHLWPGHLFTKSPIVKSHPNDAWRGTLLQGTSFRNRGPQARKPRPSEIIFHKSICIQITNSRQRPHGSQRRFQLSPPQILTQTTYTDNPLRFRQTSHTISFARLHFSECLYICFCESIISTHSNGCNVHNQYLGSCIPSNSRSHSNLGVCPIEVVAHQTVGWASSNDWRLGALQPWSAPNLASLVNCTRGYFQLPHVYVYVHMTTRVWQW